METSDLDLPLLPSAEQIRRREFASVRRGYDPQQVRDYLTLVAAQVETLERDMREGNGDAMPPTPSGIQALTEMAEREAPEVDSDDPYERVARRFAVVFETADTEAEEILGRARDEASRVLTEARSDADGMRVDAQARAEEARQEGREALERAKSAAEETMGDLQSRRLNLVKQLDGMRTTLLAVAEDLQLTDEDDDEVFTEEAAEAPVGIDPEKVEVTAESDDDEEWLFEGGLDIPELELSDPEQDERGPS